MTVAPHNYLKSIKPQILARKIKEKENYEEILAQLGLDKKLSKNSFVEYLLVESKKLLNKEQRNEALIVLRSVKAILPQVPVKYHAEFYLRLADSFLLSNDYEGAEKAATKSETIASELKDTNLSIRVFNLLFIINRTIGKDKSIEYLQKSKELSEKHNIYENTVFCDINFGLLHYFKKEHNKAAEYCKNVIEIISEKPYPNERLLMPTDYFLQVFSENPVLVVSPKYKDTVLKGVSVVIRALKQLSNDYEATRRLSILASFLKLSDALVDNSMNKIVEYIESLNVNKKSPFYSALGRGIGDYKDFQYALMYFEKALEFVNYIKDEEQRKIRKGLAYILSSSIGVSMLYDLDSSPQTSQNLKNLAIKTNSKNLLSEKKETTVSFKNAVSDSDAAFSIKRKYVASNLLEILKEKYEIQKNITAFTFQRSNKELINNLEIFCINTLTQDDEVQSLLLAGTTMDEKNIKRGKKIFSGYQILGHIVPKTIQKEKHLEDFDMRFLFDLIRAPQKFKEIEFLVPSDDVEITYTPFYRSK
ncbi:MAG: hypothetical protein H7645_09260 [Candidatus Heimdallarchaeota archaeon]|nr:hypothetical protein [Candidatus Heimdallarchaeota archaeon]MCK4770515.1 hypothetical protein [Candidatus Heimdallarchaeota archaeon]